MHIFRSLLTMLAAGSLASSLSASDAPLFHEDFASDPASRGWLTSGDASLFSWNTANQNLAVTWDSSRPNSYFYRPLGATLTKTQDFSFSFDLRLQDIMAGADPEKPFAFEIAVGLLNWSNATSASFLRGTGMSTPNLVEFDYFPDTGFGATISPTIISSNNQFAYAWAYNELLPGELYHVEMSYSSTNRTLVTTVTRNGQPYASANTVLGTNFTDFSVDTLAISSYSDAGQDPDWDGSILAHGTMDNISLTMAPPPLSIHGRLSYKVQFASLTNYIYHLETTTNFQAWARIGSKPGTGAQLTIDDDDWSARKFYRVVAEKP